MNFSNIPTGEFTRLTLELSGLAQTGLNHWVGTGVVLSRKSSGTGSLRLGLFLKGQGLFHVNTPGAQFSGKKGPRFGSCTEPFTWGTFKLRCVQNSQNFYIEAIDVTDSMLGLRHCQDTLRTAIHWVRLIMKRLPWGHPADDLMANLYWNMRLLATPGVLVPGVNWRFLWRWLTLGGLAPHTPDDWRTATGGQSFTKPEISFLETIGGLNITKSARVLTDLASGRSDLPELFMRGSRCAERLLALYTT